MKRFFSVVGAFIIATGLSCTAFTGLGFADSVDDSLEEDGETDYDTVRQAAIDTIEDYLANLAGGLDDDELKNKNLNTEQKAEVIKAYNLLNSEDQAPYTELIARIERGGIPQLEYVGEAEYDRAEDIDYLQVIRATDNEDNNADGVMDLNADNTSCELTQEYTIDNATYQPYTLRCSVTDSDGNTGSLTQEVRIKTTIVDDEEDPGHTPDDPAGDPGDDNPDDQNPGPGDNPDDPGTNPPDDGKTTQIILMMITSRTMIRIQMMKNLTTINLVTAMTITTAIRAAITEGTTVLTMRIIRQMTRQGATTIQTPQLYLAQAIPITILVITPVAALSSRTLYQTPVQVRSLTKFLPQFITLC